jgi:hypothetical protein
MIKSLSVNYPIKESCLSLGVSRSGYYQWLKNTLSLRQRQEGQLRAEIARIFEQNRKRYGSPRVTQVLRAAGRQVGKNRVARLMRQQKLVARPKRAFRPKTTVAFGQAEPNRIAALEAEGPDQIWGERYYLRGHRRRLAVPGGNFGPLQPAGGGMEIRGEFSGRAGWNCTAECALLASTTKGSDFSLRPRLPVQQPSGASKVANHWRGSKHEWPGQLLR